LSNVPILYSNLHSMSALYWVYFATLSNNR
jgi:hypothetical protein